MADPITTSAAVTALTEIGKTSLSVFLVYTTHYSSAKIYNFACVPDGLSGYFMGMITTSSPWCRLILELMKLSDSQYYTVIMVVLTRLLVGALGL